MRALGLEATGVTCPRAPSGWSRVVECLLLTTEKSFQTSQTEELLLKLYLNLHACIRSKKEARRFVIAVEISNLGIE